MSTPGAVRSGSSMVTERDGRHGRGPRQAAPRSEAGGQAHSGERPLDPGLVRRAPGAACGLRRALRCHRRSAAMALRCPPLRVRRAVVDVWSRPRGVARPRQRRSAQPTLGGSSQDCPLSVAVSRPRRRLPTSVREPEAARGHDGGRVAREPGARPRQPGFHRQGGTDSGAAGPSAPDRGLPEPGVLPGASDAAAHVRQACAEDHEQHIGLPRGCVDDVSP